MKKDKEENNTSKGEKEQTNTGEQEESKGFISKSIKAIGKAIEKVIEKIVEGIKSIISGIGNFFKGLLKKDVEVKNVTLLSSKDNTQSKTEDASIFSSIWDFIWDVIYYLGWYRRAEKPSNPGNQETVDKVINYEIINYINDVSLENAEVLMTSDMKGNYTSSYTYGLDRISVDNLKVVNNSKIDPLYYIYDGRGSVSELVNKSGQVTYTC